MGIAQQSRILSSSSLILCCIMAWPRGGWSPWSLLLVASLALLILGHQQLAKRVEDIESRLPVRNPEMHGSPAEQRPLPG